MSKKISIIEDDVVKFSNIKTIGGEDILNSGDIDVVDASNVLSDVAFSGEYLDLKNIPSPLGINKTYASVSEMQSDTTPQDNGVPLERGAMVSVVNSLDPLEDAVYRFLDPGWEIVGLLSDMRDYAKSGGSEKTVQEIDDEIVQLAGDVTNFQNTVNNSLTQITAEKQVFESEAQEIKNAIENMSAAKIYSTLDDAIAESPKPADGTPFSVMGDGDNDGYWKFDSNETDGVKFGRKFDRRIQVESISLLKSYKGRPGEAVDVLGYYESGDGGGGTFYWDSASTEEDNGGTIIESSGEVNGRWKRRYEGAVNVKWFGTTGVNDSAKVEKAILASGGDLEITSDVNILTAIAVTGDFRLRASAKITGGGTKNSIFSFLGAAGKIDVKGGHFTNFKSAFYIKTDVTYVSFSDALFTNGLQGITSLNQSGSVFGGENLRVSRCDFESVEVGLNSFEFQWKSVQIDSVTAKNLFINAETVRSHPYSKYDLNGIRISLSTVIPASALVTNCFVDGVTQTMPPELYTETHGIAVALDGELSDIVIDGCTVRNVSGTRTGNGVEGLMGRGGRVIISNNTLFDAGGAEGCIYSKGSKYHKIIGNTIEVSANNPNQRARGIISTGTHSDITGNKFIKCYNAIYSRSIDTFVTGNEFVQCFRALAVQCHEDAQHKNTTFSNNKIYGDATSFGVSVGTPATGVVHGNFVIMGNHFYGNVLCTLKDAVFVAIKDNFITRDPAAVDRELIDFGAAVGDVHFSNNIVTSFQNAAADGRVITGRSNAPKMKIENNFIANGNNAIRLRDNNYDEVIIRGNHFSNVSIPVNGTLGTNYNVSGLHLFKDNIGLDDTDKDEPYLGKPATNGEILSSTAAGVRSWIPNNKARTEKEITSATQYTAIKDDATKYLIFKNPVEFIINNGIFAKDDELQWEAEGGAVTVSAGAGVTINYPATLTNVVPQYGVCWLRIKESNEATLFGNLNSAV